MKKLSRAGDAGEATGSETRMVGGREGRTEEKKGGRVGVNNTTMFVYVLSVHAGKLGCTSSEPQGE